jgi:two-component system, cell cycle sensor histidine kinase and response regulator CckA
MPWGQRVSNVMLLPEQCPAGRRMNPSLGITDRPARILIVDDERHNRQLLDVMLAGEGFVLLTAASGEEALAVVAQHPPDLILLDIMMPGVDGYAVVAAIKANDSTKNIPVIVVTALEDRDARLLALGAGAEDFLTKPVDRAELTVRVRNLLRLKAYGDYHQSYSQMLEGEVGSRAADLVESERLYRSTFDEAPVGIVHVDLDGTWLRVNQRLCDMLGYSRDELHGSAAQELLQSEQVEGERDALRRLAAGTLDRHVVDEKRYRRRDDSLVWARVNMSVHRGAQGQPLHFILVIEDITERRTLEAQFRQANKMDAIGRLASGIAHDFNNLLTVIVGFAEFVAADVNLPSQHGEDLGEIVKAAGRATGLTKQLLAFSRQQVLHAEPLDLNVLISDMTGMLGRLIGEHITVSLALAPHLSLALADRGQLEQVVMNLVVNARDAMPDGGSVVIETTDVDLENSLFHQEVVMRGRYVMLAITDTGCGMTNETRRRLFEPFFTTKDAGKGTGLGLSTTYGIVKQSKGYIWVYSEPGLGTTFKVYLPRADREVGAQEGSSAIAVPVKRASETVLLVEDEAGVRLLSKRILDTAGYRVLEAENGDQAERLFARHADAIDLVVTDVMMPGCGGPELMGRLQVHRPDLRVLYMSGYTEQSAAHKAGIGRGLPFVQKPFTAVEFMRHVRDALER